MVLGKREDREYDLERLYECLTQDLRRGMPLGEARDVFERETRRMGYAPFEIPDIGGITEQLDQSIRDKIKLQEEHQKENDKDSKGKGKKKQKRKRGGEICCCENPNCFIGPMIQRD